MKIGALVSFFAVLLVACTPPGQGLKAHSGYEAAGHVIDALALYHSEHAVYPDTLLQMVPGYIHQSELVVRYRDGTTRPFQYRRIGDRYELSFTYYGPGGNRCVYDSVRRSWKCYGWY